MKVEILGMGCPKCKMLAELAGQALAEAGVEAEIVKVQDMDKIIEFGVMVTPALAIDGTVKCAGKLPTKADILKWIQE